MELLETSSQSSKALFGGSGGYALLFWSKCVGAEVHDLPPYSPDRNSIELAFNNGTRSLLDFREANYAGEVVGLMLTRFRLTLCRVRRLSFRIPLHRTRGT